MGTEALDLYDAPLLILSALDSHKVLIQHNNTLASVERLPDGRTFKVAQHSPQGPPARFFRR